MMEYLGQVILLLLAALSIVVVFQRLHIPTSLGYLLVGVVLGPYTMGPVVSMPGLQVLAEFGIVFLLFTIGLGYSLPQLNALRHQIVGLGTGQVVITSAVLGLLAWLAGLPVAAAFVMGAVFAQSSTTIISNILSEQAEEYSHHGRLGLAMSVFQDVTAVPFLVIIPVLGTAISALVLAQALGLALAKAVLAFAIVFIAGRWLLRPLFHAVSQKKSLEMFTLAVLLVTLVAAWTTNNLGLSLAFGAFLAGMMLGETEFQHQVEASIRPFRDVLLGLFFVGIGMRFDPSALLTNWNIVLLAAPLVVAVKALIVLGLVRRAGHDWEDAVRTGLMMGVGGEFGLALVAIALDARVLDPGLGQVAITTTLLTMVLGAVLIRFNRPLARWAVRSSARKPGQVPSLPTGSEKLVVIGGYGRVGHTIAVLLHDKGIPFVAFDTDPQRMRSGRAEGHLVRYGDISDPSLLSAIRIERASLVVMTVAEPQVALKTLSYLSRNYPQVPVIARARDLETSARLVNAGALHAHPEAIEASLRLGAMALELLKVPMEEIEGELQSVRDWGYTPVLDPEPDPAKEN